MLLKIIVYFIDGMRAVLGTGVVEMSTATVISPVLIIFLEMNAYQTIEKALASDVLASAISAYTYEKIKIMIYRNVIIMIIIVLRFTTSEKLYR